MPIGANSTGGHIFSRRLRFLSGFDLFGFSAAKENFLISRVPSILMFDMKTLRFFHDEDDDDGGDKRHHDHGHLHQ